MAFKIVALFASLAYASAGYIEADNHHAPLAHYSSAPAVSYSTFTRGLPSPKLAVAKSVAYAEPAVHYAAPLTKSYAVHEPSLLKTSVVAQPAYTKTIVQQPAYAKTIVSEPVYAHAAPVVAHQPLTYSAPVAYSAPIVKNVEYSKTLLSQPAYTHSVVAEPTYAKTILSEPVYHKTIVQQQPAIAKTYVSEPVYAHAAPVVAAKSLSYSPAHISYDNSHAQHGW